VKVKVTVKESKVIFEKSKEKEDREEEIKMII